MLEPAGGQPSFVTGLKFMNHPAIILVEPQLSSNMGMVARAMANFALPELRLVRPKESHLGERARAAAAGADEILESALVFESLETAIADLHVIHATTARQRDLVIHIRTPEQVAEIIQVDLEKGLKTGVLFGRENSGLTNDEIALSDGIIVIPVNPEFASLNLSQAVMVFAYEWLKQSGRAALGRRTEFDGPMQEGFHLRESQRATKEDLFHLFQHLESELDSRGFLRPPEKRPIMVRNIRRIFQRIGATEQEIRTLRGIVAALTRDPK